MGSRQIQSPITYSCIRFVSRSKIISQRCFRFRRSTFTTSALQWKQSSTKHKIHSPAPPHRSSLQPRPRHGQQDMIQQDQNAIIKIKGLQPSVHKTDLSEPNNEYISMSQLGVDSRANWNRILASTREPILIYEAASYRQLHLISYTSMGMFVWLAKFNFEPYLAYTSNMWLLVVASLPSLMWITMAGYLATAPSKLIRSISAIPSKEAARNPGAFGPLLSVEFGQALPFIKPRPLQIHAADMTRDVNLVYQVQQLSSAETATTSRFSAIRADVLRMINRRSFAYLSIPKGGLWKIGLPGKFNLDNGSALDQILRLDSKRTPWWRSNLRES